MAASVLSPLAQPFHPHLMHDVNPIVYNDGMPAMTFQGSESDFLHAYEDQTIEEAFPPNAEEAAELEAVECFVEMMATYEMLEEREEATRTVHAGLRKRWEARRELVGRPRPAKHIVTQVVHGVPHLLDSSDIVLHDSTRMMQDRKSRAMEASLKTNHRITKQGQGRYQQKHPIHQPRKHY